MDHQRGTADNPDQKFKKSTDWFDAGHGTETDCKTQRTCATLKSLGVNCQGCWLRPLISGRSGGIHKVSPAVAGIFLYLYAASRADTVHRRKMSCPSAVYCQSDFSTNGLHKNSTDYLFRQASSDGDFLPVDRLLQTVRWW